ncbi:replication restart helicase PriA [Bythopirellula goksoeyrii]|uniref:Replication restart protein PriA n=1 Tax=Bythopirellula goksoeyrii TaxID=1400387 RepID=A0A5B9QJR6_9BACT|nr:primosomal protein N' [Bythopirellula goksoeyrii]QEG37286.1 Primosomal protein N' [Bythopirellula goksoeyrii]
MSKQQSLFDDAPAEWELDAQSQRLVATVVLGEGATGEYDYLVPEALSDRERGEYFLEVGRRVRVPFGRSNRKVVGYCVALETKLVDAARLKSVAEVIDAHALLSPAMLRLTRWMADYYLCKWGEVLEAVVPAGVRLLAGTRKVTLLAVPEDVRETMGQLKLGSPQQRKALDYLAGCGRTLTTAQLADAVGCTAGPIKQLLKKGLIESHEKRVRSGEFDEITAERESPLVLNEDQQRAFDAINAALESGEARGMVLFGVTGSGKTEVYLQAIERVVGYGRQAIVLVPEISLTPQTVRRFRARFDGVAVLHSHQSHVERHREWQRIARGEVQVVVGARSAVFAPTPNLGLIVVDEEHESSFKQDSSPRYHARDVAWQRAQAEEIPLVLGSATPSLESWYKTEQSEFARLDLPSRVSNRPLPDVVTVDLRDSAHTKFSRGAISRPLHQAMVAALRDQGQVILLLNRRGFSTHVQCPACGYVAECPACEMSLTFHRQESILRCHYCDYHEPPPVNCPDCKSPAIRYGGMGTQKLEAEVLARFPEHTCERMDTDSMRKAGSHQQVLDRFSKGEIDILLGTQMIAKGLDFPNVTLVGVINADTALHLPDFRAGERTFQLVAQVAGRTGRGEKGGRVLVQTLSPEHMAIRAAVRHDFEMFAEEDLTTRRQLGYPPFGSMIRILVRGPAEETARAVAEGLAERLKREVTGEEGIRIMGPAAAAIPKLRDHYRFQIQLQAPTLDPLRSAVQRATTRWKVPDGVFLAVDVDPWDMM